LAMTSRCFKARADEKTAGAASAAFGEGRPSKTSVIHANKRRTSRPTNPGPINFWELIPLSSDTFILVKGVTMFPKILAYKHQAHKILDKQAGVNGTFFELMYPSFRNRQPAPCGARPGVHGFQMRKNILRFPIGVLGFGRIFHSATRD